MAYNPLSVRGYRVNAANLNTTGDVVTFTGLPAQYIVERLIISGWSATPAAILAATLQDAAAAGGNSLVGAIAALNTPITATSLNGQFIPLAAALGATRNLTASSLYLNVSVANGTALTADVTLFVLPLA